MDSKTETPEDPRSRDLVSIGNYPNALVAESARSCLEMEGLDAFVFDGEIANMNGFYTAALGGVKVMVACADEARGRALLDSRALPVPEDVVAPEDEIAPDGVYCEKCHSKRVRTRTCWGVERRPLLRTLTRFFFRTKVLRCTDCGYAVRS
ncbi:MAG TPA: hypothetical protein VN931_09790 [Fibrobacteria bacterium]|nr:hypothetical protein [Fibrobacteria bacterium]